MVGMETADETQERTKEIPVRKVIVSEFVTLDGVMEDPGGSEGFEHGGWAFRFDRGPEGDEFKLDEVLASDALLLGRTTYQDFAEAWPSRESEFADKFNSMPKYVVSTTHHPHLRAGRTAGRQVGLTLGLIWRSEAWRPVRSTSSTRARTARPAKGRTSITWGAYSSATQTAIAGACSRSRPVAERTGHAD
jgi:dihydrofolate reductase